MNGVGVWTLGGFETEVVAVFPGESEIVVLVGTVIGSKVWVVSGTRVSVRVGMCLELGYR